MSKRYSLSLFLVLVLLALVHNAYYSPQLPPVVASHFDATGSPNGWMARQAFSLLYASMVILLAGMFLLTGRLLDWVPDRMVSLPNKAYWLDPSRREETHTFFRQWGYLFGGATIAFIIAVMHLVIRVNLGLDRVLHAGIVWLLGIYVLYTGAMTIALYRRFSRVPPDREKK
jgi:uncharacterized membrane protein